MLLTEEICFLLQVPEPEQRVPAHHLHHPPLLIHHPHQVLPHHQGTVMFIAILLFSSIMLIKIYHITKVMLITILLFSSIILIKFYHISDIT